MPKLNFNIRGKEYILDIKDTTTVEECIKILNDKGAKVSKIIFSGKTLDMKMTVIGINKQTSVIAM